jgi:TM2 domain-containing membrane protein YozV
MNFAMKDYYKILNITRDADEKAIRKAYHGLAKIYHPDVSNLPDAEERFKAINEAYSVLSDPTKRAAYDAGTYNPTGGQTAQGYTYHSGSKEHGTYSYTYTYTTGSAPQGYVYYKTFGLGPVIAIILSFFVPGAGQLYKGHFLKCFLFLFGIGICVSLITGYITFLLAIGLGILLWLVNMGDVIFTPMNSKRNPFIAAILSLIPGLGQFYTVQAVKGIVLLLSTALFLALSTFMPLFGALVLVLIFYSIYDAWQAAEQLNTGW